jgi:Fic family protein
VVLGDVLVRAELAKRLVTYNLNERQRLMLDKLLCGHEGKLTAKRWAADTRCSTDTAQRDLRELFELKLLKKNPGGSKNTSYALNTCRR